MRRKRDPDQETRSGGRLTPVDVQQVEFRLAFRGYNERDVDAFLDRVTEDLASYIDESERVPSGREPGSVAATAFGGGTDAATREAESIIARARDEAAAIIRRAEQQAAAVGAASSGDARSAVAPFLNTEREFLQSLGSLVQTHAEEIKEMVLALRERARAGGAAHDASSAAPAVAHDEDIASDASSDDETEMGASAAEIRERLGEPELEGASDDAPVVIESATEPAYSSEGVPANEGRERSLRELFWGEET
jgi:cell division initiation protein